MICFRSILYLGAVAGLFASAVNAAEPMRLTTDGQRKLAPSFVLSGEAIVYAAHTVPNRVSIVQLSLKDGQQSPLYSSGSAHQFDPAFSVDGRYHAYCRTMSSPQIALVIKDTETGKESVFTPEGARSTARGPKIMPDGSRVVFTISAPGGQQIATVNMQGKDLKRLTETVDINFGPAISPDGKWIAFSSARAGNLDIYVMNVDSGDVRRLTNTAEREMRPAWSPDGKRIAFTSVRDGNHEVYVMDSAGNNVLRVTDHPEMDDWPVWHPDGKRLLTVSQRRGRFDLYLWNLDE